MILLGTYTTKDGKHYDCHFFPNEKIAQAVGPLPLPGQVGARGPLFEVTSECEKEAKEKLAEMIGPGNF